MVRKSFGRSSLLFVAFSLIVILCSGCETWKGMKRDMETMMGWDKEFQEAFW